VKKERSLSTLLGAVMVLCSTASLAQTGVGDDRVGLPDGPAFVRMMVRVARQSPGSGGGMGATSLLSFRPHTA
jgi:hypothetical protein